MKKRVSFIALLLTFSLGLTGCGGQASSRSPVSGSSGSRDTPVPTVPSTENVSTDGPSSALPENPPEDAVSLKDSIVELEPGLSAVRYDGDYGFDSFLEKGGASSDREVAQYLAETFIGELGLDFLGNIFGCSTITANGPDGGILFGRNFDWKACEAMIVEAHPERG